MSIDSVVCVQSIPTTVYFGRRFTLRISVCELVQQEESVTVFDYTVFDNKNNSCAIDAALLSLTTITSLESRPCRLEWNKLQSHRLGYKIRNLYICYFIHFFYTLQTLCKLLGIYWLNNFPMSSGWASLPLCTIFFRNLI